MSISCNVVHASDTIENAKAEVERFFTKENLYEYNKSEFEHVYAEDERG